jgi:hypothetical protein
MALLLKNTCSFVKRLPFFVILLDNRSYK